MHPDWSQLCLTPGSLRSPVSTRLPHWLCLMAGIPVPYLGLKLLTLPTVSDMQQVLKKCAMNERREDVGAGGEGRAIALLLRWGGKKEQQSSLGHGAYFYRICASAISRLGRGQGWCNTAASAEGFLLPCSTILQS